MKKVVVSDEPWGAVLSVMGTDTTAPKDAAQRKSDPARAAIT
jgi:hypothetical protein